MEPGHETVLLREAVEALDVAPADTIVDATIGGGGHFTALLERLGAEGTLVGIDADLNAAARARKIYAEDRRSDRPTAHVANDNFRNLARILERLKIGAVDGILFDLGWSGYQLLEQRGFSFQADEPLIMAYGEGGETAADIVNSATEQELADIIFTYGEERFSRGIAKAIVQARGKARILTTAALVAAITEGTPAWYGKRKIHPATKTFQALRIAVNDEIGALREALSAALEALTPGGRIAVISFHSIEDRVVKGMLRDAVHSGQGSLVAKKPVVPGRAEVLRNRRARSAKLRIFERSAAAHGAESIITHSAVHYA
jgi:16S rRNA (cytosine1402-N4)-methyltransferase